MRATCNPVFCDDAIEELPACSFCLRSILIVENPPVGIWNEERLHIRSITEVEELILAR